MERGRTSSPAFERVEDADWPAVFISYRRDDTSDEVRKLHAEYCKLYSPASIFLDTKDIRAGAQFPNVLRDRVTNAKVVLVVIGPDWPPGRLNEPKDWVRQEIRLALQSERQVIPVLVNGAAMPKESDLPVDVRPLISRNHFTLSSAEFTSDLRRLLNELGPAVSSRSELSAWQETSLFASGIGMNVLARLRNGLKGSESMVLYGDKGGWFDPALNLEILRRSLRNEALRYDLLPERWLAHGSPADNARKRYAIERKLLAGAFISNEPKVRLASDLLMPISEPLKIQETDYVSSLMTDQMAFVRVSRDTTVLCHETEGFLERDDGAVRLLPLSKTKMSNQIGVSTLAFSSDGALLLVRQTKTNAQSAGTLAPTGSGSLDWDDLVSAEEADLLAAVRYGGARELIEECGLHEKLSPQDFAKQMHVYAFARMIHRGGKPEFFCVAQLPFTAAEVHASAPSRYEQQFSQHSESARAERIDRGKDIRSEVIRVCRHFSDVELRDIDDQALTLSYPLHHALDLLSDSLSQNTPQAGELSDFIAAGLRV